MGELFGKYLRAKRQELNRQRGGYSIRKLAQRIRIHHSFLSKVERGEPATLSTRRLLALAREMGEDPDLLLAMNGKLAPDVIRAVLRRPVLFQCLLRDLRQGESAQEPSEPGLADRLARAEGWLRQAEEDLRAVPFLLSPEGLFTRISPSLETCLDIRRADMIGRGFTVLVHPEDGTMAKEHLRHALEGRAGVREYRVPREGGTAGWARISLAPRLGGRDRLLEVQGLIQDVDARRRAEAALGRAEVAASAARLAKQEFLANMSHELRTPLNGLLGMLQLLCSDSSAKEAREFLEQALESGRRLQTLLSDLLDFARLDSGRINLRKVPFAPGRVLAEVAELFGPACQAKGLSLSCEAGENLPPEVLGDEARLRQALSLLADNAVRFTEHGGVRLRAQSLPPVHNREARVFFSVADTGPGIPEVQLSRIFEPFTQVDGSLSRRHQGLGLGLAHCRSLVRLMNGELWVESVPESGSRFAFSLGFDLAGG